MNLRKIVKLYEKILSELPSTYPRPKLAIYQDEDCMLDNTELKKSNKYTVYATFNHKTNTVGLPIDKCEKMCETDIARLMLHELYHAYAGKKYGYHSKQYRNEEACDAFASRWIKKIDIGIYNKKFLGWTDSEINYLKRGFKHLTRGELTSKLGRSWSAIRNKAYKLGLTRR